MSDTSGIAPISVEVQVAIIVNEAIEFLKQKLEAVEGLDLNCARINLGISLPLYSASSELCFYPNWGEESQREPRLFPTEGQEGFLKAAVESGCHAEFYCARPCGSDDCEKGGDS